MYSNMKYYENICNCLRVIQQDINRKLKSANCWQQTSLSERKQAVDNGHGHSEFIQIKSGVPQESILGPTLFSLFMTDLFTKFCFCDFYADDATFHTHSDNLETIEHSLQTDGSIA